MQLVQLLIPIYDNRGRRFSRARYHAIIEELTAKFGGLTAYLNAPATGLWKKRSDTTRRDDLVVYEVMVERLDRKWWSAYRGKLEARFDQDELVVRAHTIRRL
jgi:hypothetical protein